MRLPASRASRCAASGGNVILLVSKRSCAAVETLLTFCPPGPEARTKTISRSFSSMERSREIRSMGASQFNNIVMPGLVPGIHVFTVYIKNVDGGDIGER